MSVGYLFLDKSLGGCGCLMNGVRSTDLVLSAFHEITIMEGTVSTYFTYQNSLRSITLLTNSGRGFHTASGLADSYTSYFLSRNSSPMATRTLESRFEHMSVNDENDDGTRYLKSKVCTASISYTGIN